MKAAPLPVPVASWTGCYIGGGYGLWDQENTNFFDATATSPRTQVSVTDSAGGRGWFGTVQGGCDYQFGLGNSQFVLGAFACTLVIYGQWFFSSNEKISGATRDHVIRKVQDACIARQLSLRQANPAEVQISIYCTCVGIHMAENTTYKRLASDTNEPDVQDYLKQQAAAAGQYCRTWITR